MASQLRSAEFSDQSLTKMEVLLSSYYGMAEEKNQDHDKTNMDSPAFNHEEHVRNMIKSMSLNQLLEKDTDMCHEIKSLDSDMQMLVYENYNKFISATDTIRKMKNNVENMESEITSLLTIMSSISEKSNKVNERLAPRRAQVEKLVSVRRLLKRLEFIFELPQKLNLAISKEQFAQAAKYYNVAVVILKRYSHIEAFRAISKESTEIMTNLKDLLLKKIEEPSIKPNLLTESIAVLLQFKETSQSLCDKFLQWFRLRFTSQIDRFIAKNVQDTQLLKFFSAIHEEFLNDYLNMVQSYSADFIKENNDSVAFKKRLIEFTDEIFARYFNAVSKQFCRRNEDMLREDADIDKELIDEYHHGAGDYRVLVFAVQQFINEISRADVILPEARLHEKAVTVVDAAINFQIDSLFALLKTNLVSHLKIVFEKISLAAAGTRNETHKDILKSFIRLYVNDIEETFRILQPLIRTTSVLISETGQLLSASLQRNFEEFISWQHTEFLSLLDPISYDSESSNEIFMTKLLNLVRSGNSFDIGTKHICILAWVSREFASSSISQAAKALEASLPRIDQITQGKKQSVDITRMIESTNDVSQMLMGYFVDLHGRKVSSALREFMYSINWLKIDEPRDVSNSMDFVLNQAILCIKEANEVLNEPNPFQAALSNDKDFRRLSNSIKPQQDRFLNRGVAMDVERLFRRKVDIHGKIEFTLESIVNRLFKIAIKTILEVGRNLFFSRNGFQQVLVDLKFLELMIPFFVNDANDLGALLNLAIMSTADRCCEEPVRLPLGAIAAITSTKKAKLNLDFC